GGRRELADVHGHATRGRDARQDAARILRSGGPVVASNSELGRAAQTLPSDGREGLADGVGDVDRELVTHGAADVVFAEDGGGELHEPRGKSAPAGRGGRGMRRRRGGTRCRPRV